MNFHQISFLLLQLFSCLTICRVSCLLKWKPWSLAAGHSPQISQKELLQEMDVCGQCTLERSMDLNMANEMPLKASGGLREMTGSAVSLTCCERRLAVSTYRPGWW